MKKFVPNAPEEEEEPSLNIPVPQATKTKKHKPMSKHEQESRIRQIEQGINQFGHSESGTEHNDAMQSIENQQSSSDDDSEESEEE